MKRSSFTPIYVSRSFVKMEKPLNCDALPDFLRNESYDPNQEYESVYVPTTGLTVYPLIVDPLTAIPVLDNVIVPKQNYVRTAIGIKFDSSYAGKIIYLYKPKITYGSGSKRDDNLNYRSDGMSSLYLKVGKSIQDRVTLYDQFRVTIPYENAPDKIAHKVYGSIDYWWVIMQYNGFIYPEHIALDSIIRVPNYDQTRAWLNETQPTASSALQYKGERIRL